MRKFTLIIFVSLTCFLIFVTSSPIASPAETETNYLSGLPYTLTVSRNGSGTITSDPSGIDCGANCVESYIAGTQVTLTATPETGWSFTNWNGCDSSSGATCYVTVNSDRTVTTTFTSLYFTLSVSKTGSGTITSDPSGINCGTDCTESYISGTQVTLTATPDLDNGWIFSNWSGCGSSSGTACYVTVNSNMNVWATFTWPPYFTLSVSKTGSGAIASDPSGINCGNDCTENYTHGTRVTLEASRGNFAFSGWNGCDSSSLVTCYVTMNSNKSVTATFTEAPAFTAEVAWSKQVNGGFVQQTFDGGYILIGVAGLIKTDSAGNEEWSKPFEGVSAGQQTKDGGYILAGYTGTETVGFVTHLIKTGPSGNEEWSKDYPEVLARTVSQTSDGGYIIGGQWGTRDDDPVSDYLLKTDSFGNKLWSKGYVCCLRFGYRAYSVQQTSDGGYIVGGQTCTYDSYCATAYLSKTDSTGSEEWIKTFGWGHAGRAASVKQTADGGYIVAGSASTGDEPSDALLLKTDSLGNEEWSRIWGGGDLDSNNSVQQTSDGGFIVAGRIYPPQQYAAGFLLKTDSLGNGEWSLTVGSSANSVQQTMDGGYIAGIVAGDTTWLIKLSCLRGDMNNDGKVDISDILKGLRITLHLDPGPSTEAELCRSDLDDSGEIDILDIIRITRKTVGLD